MQHDLLPLLGYGVLRTWLQKKEKKKEMCKNRGDAFYRNQKKIGGGSKTRKPILVTFFSGFVCLLSLFFLSFLLFPLILSPLPSDAIGFGFL